jgi:hypothetical protein
MRGSDELRKMRLSGMNSLFVVLGPSGSGKSSFLRAGLIPHLQRDDRNFVVLGTVRPGRNAITGDDGLAAAIHSARRALKLPSAPPLGEIKKICRDGNHERVHELLAEVRAAAAQRLAQIATAGPQVSGPTLVLPLDQAEELFSSESVSARAAEEPERFLELLAAAIGGINTDEVRLIVAATIRTVRYEAMQNHPALDGIGTELFNELKTMPHHQFPAAIKGPAARASEAGGRLSISFLCLPSSLAAHYGAGHRHHPRRKTHSTPLPPTAMTGRGRYRIADHWFVIATRWRHGAGAAPALWPALSSAGWRSSALPHAQHRRARRPL